MWRVKTDAKFENSFFPVLIYWSDNRIHLGTIKKWTFVLLVPPPTESTRTFVINQIQKYSLLLQSKENDIHHEENCKL